MESIFIKRMEEDTKNTNAQPDEIEIQCEETEVKYDRFGCIIGHFLTLSDYFEYAKSVGISTFQCMFGDSISTDRQVFQNEEIIKMKIEYPTFKCFSHLPFTFSLVGTKAKGIFNIDLVEKKFIDHYAWRISKAIEQELTITREFGGGSVIHPGGCIGTVEESIDAMVRFIDCINYPEGSKLLLENSAGEGKKIATLDNLNKVYQKCKVKEHIFFCIDTAHIFASGEYDISKPEEIDRLYDDIQSRMGIDKISLIHLNDSKVEFGEHKDRHAFSCQGKIWGDNFFAFLYFLDKFEGIPLVCETDITDVYQIRRMVYV
jgi:apurinic endonuclease APN1